MSVVASAYRFVKQHPGAAVELVLGLFLAWTFLSQPDLRRLLLILVLHAGHSLHALWSLLFVDPAGTIASYGLTVAKLTITILPLLTLARHWRGWERLRLFFWLPILMIVAWPLAGTSDLKLALAVVALTLALMRVRWFRWTVVLPLLMVVAPAANHLLGTLLWSPSDLLHRCESNDGRRPINLHAEQLTPGYVGVTEIRPGEALLAGQYPNKEHVPIINVPMSGAPMTGGSWWLRRTGSDWSIEARSQVNGGFWPGCIIDGELWLSRANIMVGVRRDATTGVESLREIDIPAHAIDFSEVICLGDRVLIGEGFSGSGIWEVSAKTGAVRRLAHEVGGLGAQMRRGRPGLITSSNGTDLVVYSLEREDVVERIPASVQSLGGMDVCPLDWEASVADLTGRLRFFKLDAQQRYRFDWGIPLKAPRVVMYSPDCEHLVATSMDDTTIWVINRAARRVVATYQVGPALRGVTFFGPREFAAVDACTMTVFNF